MSTPAATNHQGLTPAITAARPGRSASGWTEKKAEARRRRKNAQRTPRQRNALELAQELLLLADREEYAPWRSDLNHLVNRVRLSGKRTPDRDVEAVRRALGKPLCYRLDDISEESEIPERELLPILRSMASCGIVEEREVTRASSTSGRNEKGWFLTNRPPRSPMVLP